MNIGLCMKMIMLGWCVCYVYCVDDVYCGGEVLCIRFGGGFFFIFDYVFCGCGKGVILFV